MNLPETDKIIVPVPAQTVWLETGLLSEFPQIESMKITSKLEEPTAISFTFYGGTTQEQFDKLKQRVFEVFGEDVVII